MIGQHLRLKLAIAYYGTMSKLVQYRRNASKNNIFSIQANVLPNKVVQEVLQ